MFRTAHWRPGRRARSGLSLSGIKGTTACGTRTTAVPTSARLRSRVASSGARPTPARGMQTTRDRISAARPKDAGRRVATTPARGTRTTTVRISATHGRRSKPRGPSNQTQSRTLLDPNKRNSGDDTEHQADQELVNAMACERQTRPEDRGDHRDERVADRGTE